MALSIAYVVLYVFFLFASSSNANAQEWNSTHGGRTRHTGISVSVGSRHAHRAPVVVRPRYHRHGPTCTFVGGYYQERQTRVWVPGRERRVWLPARYEYRRGVSGHVHRRLSVPGHYATRRMHGHYVTRNERVWLPRRRVCRH